MPVAARDGLGTPSYGSYFRPNPPLIRGTFAERILNSAIRRPACQLARFLTLIGTRVASISGRISLARSTGLVWNLAADNRKSSFPQETLRLQLDEARREEAMPQGPDVNLRSHGKRHGFEVGTAQNRRFSGFQRHRRSAGSRANPSEMQAVAHSPSGTETSVIG